MHPFRQHAQQGPAGHRGERQIPSKIIKCRGVREVELSEMAYSWLKTGSLSFLKIQRIGTQSPAAQAHSGQFLHST